MFDNQPVGLTPQVATDQRGQGLLYVVQIFKKQMRRLQMSLSIRQTFNQTSAQGRHFVRRQAQGFGGRKAVGGADGLLPRVHGLIHHSSSLVDESRIFEILLREEIVAVNAADLLLTQN